MQTKVYAPWSDLHRAQSYQLHLPKFGQDQVLRNSLAVKQVFLAIFEMMMVHISYNITI